MKYLDSTFADPRRNLACDEALGEICGCGGGEVLRLWEPADYFVAVGYSNRVGTEVNVVACEQRGIPILRRFSGGGAVLQGPGCLNYTLVISNARARSFGDVGRSYQRVLHQHRRLFEGLLSTPVQIEGTSDLAVAGRKFSGNAQHRKQNYTVFHGTFLLDFDLSLMEICLPMPTRRPDYRGDRPHGSFLTNVDVDCARVRRALKEAWRADGGFEPAPIERIAALMETRYARAQWHNKF